MRKVKMKVKGRLFLVCALLPAATAGAETRLGPAGLCRDLAGHAHRRCAKAVEDYNRGLALSDRHRLDEAVAFYRKAVDRLPTFAEAWVNLGVVLAQSGRCQPAVAALTQAVSLEPGRAEAHHDLGLILAQCGDSRAAAAALQQAVTLAPESVASLHALGSALFALARLEEAAKVYTRALELQPADAAALYNAAVVLERLRRYPEALDAYRRSIRVEDSADAHNGMGVCLARLGRHREAAREYVQALALALSRDTPRHATT